MRPCRIQVARDGKLFVRGLGLPWEAPRTPLEIQELSQRSSIGRVLPLAMSSSTSRSKKSGALDFLLREVEDDIAKGRTRPMDDLCDNSWISRGVRGASQGSPSPRTKS